MKYLGFLLVLLLSLTIVSCAQTSQAATPEEQNVLAKVTAEPFGSGQEGEMYAESQCDTAKHLLATYLKVSESDTNVLTFEEYCNNNLSTYETWPSNTEEVAKSLLSGISNDPNLIRMVGQALEL